MWATVSNMVPSMFSTSPVDNESIGLDRHKIRRLRLKLKLTQEEAATLAGLPGRQRWNHIEKGSRGVSIDTLERIAKALKVNISDLLK